MLKTPSKPGDHCAKSSIELLAKHNPFRRKVYEHPGRLFMFEDQDKDMDEIKSIYRSKRTFVEIGSGSGKHLNELAKRNPETSVFGFEIRFKRSVRTIEKANKEEIENSYILRTNAQYIEQIFEKKSIDAIYINFPDPWAKKRQKKNRILNPSFYPIIKTLLKPDGFLSFKTDHQEYFQSVLSQLEQIDFLKVDEKSFDLHSSEYIDKNIETEFEALFKSQCLPIYYLKAKLISNEQTT